MKEQIDKIREAAQRITEIRWGYDGDCGAEREAYEILSALSELEQKMNGEGLGEEEIDQMVGDTAAPKVLTHAEAEALVTDLLQWCFDNPFGGVKMWTDGFRETAKKHGLSL